MKVGNHWSKHMNIVGVLFGGGPWARAPCDPLNPALL